MTEQTTHNSISLQAADKLIAAHDGDVALLYLYRLRNGGLDEEKAARDLCRTMQEIRMAEEKLRRLELFDEADVPARPSAPPPPAPAEELPQYTSAEITQVSRDNGDLQAVFSEAAKLLSHSLTAPELRVIFGMYAHLGMPAEVILELLHYCVELNERKYGKDRRVTPHFLEQEAYAWANREILTLDQAEEYIAKQRLRHDEMGRIRESLDLPRLSATQEKDLSLWLEQGFGEESIAIAADRTITNTNSLKWSYMRKILQSWHEKGLHSPAEIREKDPPRTHSAAPAAAGTNRSQKPLDDEAWKKLIGKI